MLLPAHPLSTQHRQPGALQPPLQRDRDRHERLALVPLMTTHRLARLETRDIKEASPRRRPRMAPATRVRVVGIVVLAERQVGGDSLVRGRGRGRGKRGEGCLAGDVVQDLGGEVIEGVGGGESSRGVSSGRSEEVLRGERRVSGASYTMREPRKQAGFGLDDRIGSPAWTPHSRFGADHLRTLSSRRQSPRDRPRGCARACTPPARAARARGYRMWECRGS